MTKLLRLPCPKCGPQMLRAKHVRAQAFSSRPARDTVTMLVTWECPGCGTSLWMPVPQPLRAEVMKMIGRVELYAIGFDRKVEEAIAQLYATDDVVALVTGEEQ